MTARATALLALSGLLWAPAFAQADTDLLAFLNSLTDQDFLTNPHFADPFQPVARPGDCNLDGAVLVGELITAVTVSLGKSSLASCIAGDPSGDGAVTIDELLRAVNSALHGCT